MNPITDGEKHRLFSAAASSHVEIQVLRAPFSPSLLLEFTPFFYIMAISINETHKRRKYAYVTIGSLVFVYCTYIPSIVLSCYSSSTTQVNRLYECATPPIVSFLLLLKLSSLFC